MQELSRRRQRKLVEGQPADRRFAHHRRPVERVPVRLTGLLAGLMAWSVAVAAAQSQTPVTADPRAAANYDSPAAWVWAAAAAGIALLACVYPFVRFRAERRRRQARRKKRRPTS